MKRALVQLVALAAFIALPGVASAQVQTVDPDTGSEWSQPAQDVPVQQSEPEAAASGDEWSPLGTEDEAAAADPGPIEAAPPAPQSQTTTAARGETVPRDDIFEAAEGVFGRGAEGLAGILEDILREQGEPIAYISGQEASGAFILGARWGSGVMRHQVEGDRVVYWTGPSIGFDAGADASKVFILVYNLYDGEQLFRRYPSGEGRAYLVGGFSANYLRRGDVVLIPVRLGVGARLGVNVGYMRFSERNRWLPF